MTLKPQKTIFVLMIFAVTLSQLCGCVGSSAIESRDRGDKTLSEFDKIAESIAKSLSQRGLLLKHDFQVNEYELTVEIFDVPAGQGANLKTEIESAIADATDDERANMRVIIVHEVQFDRVNWIHP